MIILLRLLALIIRGDGPNPYVLTIPTPTPTPTITVTPTPTLTPTVTPSVTPTPDITPSCTPTTTVTPSYTPTPTITPTVTTTVTPTVTPTNTVTPSITPTTTITPTVTKTPTSTPAVTPTITPTTTITPTISLSASPLPESQEMILSEIYSIKQYKGTGVLSLINRPSGRFEGDILPGDWDNFIENIGIIYATEKNQNIIPSYSRYTEADNQVVINSGLSGLVPNETYYFILKQDPIININIPDDRKLEDRDISIPRVPTCVDDRDGILNSCPIIEINQQNDKDNLIRTRSITSPISLQVNIDGYDANTSSFQYIYTFKSISANFPCRITPPSGVLSESSNVVGVFEFCNSVGCLENSFDYERDNTKILENINANIEFSVIPVSKIDIKNSANFNNGASWGGVSGQLTDVGSNGNSSYYGTYDMAGQLYEWTDSGYDQNPLYKILKGGSYKDTNRFNLSKMSEKIHHTYECFDEGNFGFRLAYSGVLPPTEFNFVKVSDTGNPSDTDSKKNYGSVPYEYYINQYMVTNNDYITFLNTVDPSGYNGLNIYDYRMDRNDLGGIEFDSSNNPGNKYVAKRNMNQKPVNFITWDRAAKYCNWINNKNIPSSITTPQNNSYNLSSERYQVNRTPEAMYFLPSINEWYKAAYYSPNAPFLNDYYLYPTQSNEPILPILSNSIGAGVAASGTCTDIVTHNFSVFCEDCLPSPECPSIKLTSHNLLSDYDITTTNNKVNLLLKLQKLQPNSLYLYEINPVISNWPSNIAKSFDIIETSGGQTSEYVSLLFHYCDIAFDSNSTDYGYNRPFEVIPDIQCGECNLSFNIDPTGLVNIDEYKENYISTILSANVYKLDSYYSYNTDLSTKDNWLNTGIEINDEDIVYIRSSGMVKYNTCFDCYSGPNGVTKDIDNNICLYNNKFRYNSLIGKINENGEEFYIGSKTVIKPESYGKLWVRINSNCESISVGRFSITLDIANRDSSCKTVEDSVNIKCDRCLIKTSRSYAVPRILTPGDNKEIILKDNGCLQYIPIIVEVTDAVPQQKYEFYFDSVDDSLVFYPKNGYANFSGGSGKITSVALFKNTFGLGVANIKLINTKNNTISTDSITIKCLNEKNCEE